MAPLTLGVLPVIGVLLFFTMSVSTNDVKDLQEITDESNKFAFDLYLALRKPLENMMVSPISVQILLALVYTGAGGNTATEMAKVLQIPDKVEDVLNRYKELIEYLEDSPLNLGLKMFLEKTLAVKPEFQERASMYFRSKVSSVNFIANPEETRKEINQWVEQKTNNKIKYLLSEGTVDSLTRMLLTTAIYFEANWATQFNPSLTKYGDFHVTPEENVGVKLIFNDHIFPFNHLPELKAKILELPYSNEEFKMVIMLPDEITGLPELENKLSTLNYTEILRSLHKVTVNVTLPQFTIGKTIYLKKILKQLGMKDLFDQSKANLDGIAENLYATSAIQKAFISLNEEGTNAAAAAALNLAVQPTYRISRSVTSTYSFTGNHPFLFIFSKKDVILFLGKVTNPQNPY
uniref:Serpin n=1 Tax=Panstrongylus megistus TaxID=65343 RepID=W8CQ92_9HEMI|nr:serpin [Panstrongylus megistus]